MRDFHCRDSGLRCDFVARGATDREVLRQAGKHAHAAHGMSVTPELERSVLLLIHDEASEAHRRSAAGPGG